MLAAGKLLNIIYPPRCLACGVETESTRGLCKDCWPEAHFISGLVCEACGLPLPGDSDGCVQYCDSCHRSPPGWYRGRAVALYDGPVRRLILALKHGDRLDTVGPVANWLAHASTDLVEPGCVVVAVPIHWRRFLRRKYNQAALLGRKFAKERELTFVPDVLQRVRPTIIQKGMSRKERIENQSGSVQVHRNRVDHIAGKPVIIVDDVMTTGATLSACSEACLSVGAKSVNVVVVARVSKSS